MIKTVYTVVTDDYDNLHPQKVTEGWNYLLFTNNPVKADPWIIKQVKDIDPFILSRKVKILHSKYIKADISIYIDGNYEIIGDMNEFLKKIKYSSGIMACKHRYRENIREELNEIIRRKLVTVKSVNDIRLKMDHIGQIELSQTGILVRDKSIPDYYFQKWLEMVKMCRRDQASFDWIFQNKVKQFPIEILKKYFKRHLHKKNNYGKKRI